MGRLTGGGGSSARERERRAGWRAREQARNGPRGGSRGREGGGGRAVAAWAGFSPAEGGAFPFFFLFSNSFIHFYIFFF
jgi:hypothetical protein